MILKVENGVRLFLVNLLDVKLFLQKVVYIRLAIPTAILVDSIYINIRYKFDRKESAGIKVKEIRLNTSVAPEPRLGSFLARLGFWLKKLGSARELFKKARL